VLHDTGALTDWARTAAPGDQVAVSGPGRGYQVDEAAVSMLIAGDESAIPAIGQLLDAVPHTTLVDVHIELSDPSARLDMPAHPNASPTWHVLAANAAPGDTFVTEIERLDEVPERVWVAGEAAALQRVRTHLFGERKVSRSNVSAHGYWKLGRSAT
jgi:NADPH-dependent ferric siderophore reductase